MKRPKDFNEYIAKFPKPVQQKLKTLRSIIKKTVPGVKEKISWGMPAYSFNGALAYFAAFRKHIGFYPMAAGIKKFKKELTGYKTSRGTVQFPHTKPIPQPLVRKIIKFRAKENLAKQKRN